MTTVMAAAVVCSSSGEVGAGGKVDLKTVSAAQAIKDTEQAGAAKHSVHTHTTTVKSFTQTIDGAQRTDQFQTDLTVESRVAGAQDAERGELRAVGEAGYLEDPGIPSDYRLGNRWRCRPPATPTSRPAPDPGLSPA